METEKQCFQCNNLYDNSSLNKHSRELNSFVKELGFCNHGCYYDYKFDNPKLMKKLKRDKIIHSLQKYHKK